MISPKVSVIIPTYNGANYIGETIKSVFNQTYTNFEIIIADDASTDQTPEIVRQYSTDPRLKFIQHEKNLGPNAARRTAISISSGQIITFLDQDDLFHPEKLQEHVVFLTANPEVGMTYNPRFDLNYGSTTIRGISRPPQPLLIKDLVMGFPIAPSEMVFTKEWGDRFDLEEDIIGGEIILTCRLIFEGCKFGYVDRILNFRRYHSGRVYLNLHELCESMLKCQDIIFSDLLAVLPK